MNPLVSICTPTYNRARTLVQTIQAILNQSFSDWELIICDDASIDDTKEMVANFQDRRIRYYRNQANLGLYANWNRAISIANGKYIAIYHDHDVYFPTIVEKSVSLLDKYPTASFVHSAFLQIDDANNVVAVDIRPFDELIPGHSMKRILANGWSSPIMAGTAMVRRDAYERVGLYDDSKYGIGCDLDMWFRLCSIGDVAYINQPQAMIRVRSKGNQLTRFKWKNLIGGLRMHKDHLCQEYRKSTFERAYELAKHAFQADMQLLTFGIRAILLESPDVVDEGKAILAREASRLTYLLYLFMHKSTFLQRFSKKVLLPFHYSRVRKYEFSRRYVAMKYLERHPELLEFLPKD